MKNNKRVLIITLIAVSAIMAGLLYFLFSNRIIDPVTPNVPDVVQTDEKLEQYRKIWSDNKMWVNYSLIQDLSMFHLYRQNPAINQMVKCISSILKMATS